jgi:hypothetical protein
MTQDIYTIFPDAQRPPGRRKYEPPQRRRKRRLAWLAAASVATIGGLAIFQYSSNRERNELLQSIAAPDQLSSWSFALHLTDEVDAALKKEARTLISAKKNWERSKVLPNAVIEHEIDCQMADNIETCVTSAYAVPRRPMNPEDRKRHFILGISSFPILHSPGKGLNFQLKPAYN